MSACDADMVTQQVMTCLWALTWPELPLAACESGAAGSFNTRVELCRRADSLAIMRMPAKNPCRAILFYKIVDERTLRRSERDENLFTPKLPAPRGREMRLLNRGEP